MRALALDVGDKRIGVALSDPTGTIASILPAIRRIGHRKDLQAVLKLIQENQVERVLIGLPLLMSGEVGEQARKVRAFGEALRAVTAVPIEYRDERLSTVAAYEIMEQSGVKKAARKKKVDSVAAAVVLQEYLNDKSRTASETQDSAELAEP
jgi:putative Holliday junction resolvase